MYSGRNGGWWAYQKDHFDIIEKAWNNGDFTECSINVCGTNYNICFSEMKQISASNNFIFRTIKRVDDNTNNYKGVAGLRYVNKEELPVKTTTSDDSFNPHYANSYIHDDS